MSKTLQPTLWRTCRALANHERLTMLVLLEKKGELTVTQMAEELGRPISAASVNLRALNARGLLKVKRRGRHVHYRIGADPSIPGVDELLRTLRLILKRRKAGRMQAFKALTGYTHSRRISIVSELQGEPLAFDALRVRCRISQPALKRHLRKLRTRNIVELKNGRYELVAPKDPLSQCLLDLSAKRP